jgi:membrane-associated phospholipid phosphatase
MALSDTQSIIRAHRWLVFGPPALALILLIAVEVTGLDRPLFSFFNNLSSFTGPAFWAHATILGDGLVCAVLLLFWVRRSPERIWGGLLGAIFMVLILRFFKGMLSLPRPLGVLPEGAVEIIGPALRRGSFPSGHTATAALLAGVWALTASRRLVPWLALGFATLVGMSRMAVGVHWPTDVLAGLALGWTAAWLGLRWAPKVPWGARGTGKRILTGALLISALVMLIPYDTGYPGVLLFQRSLAAVCLAWGTFALARPADVHDGV